MKPIHFLINKKNYKITGFKLENGTCIHFIKKEISTKYNNKYLLDYIKYNKDELIDNNLIEEYENLPRYIDNRIITMNILYYKDLKYKQFYHYCMKKLQQSDNKKAIISIINNDDNINSKYKNLIDEINKIESISLSTEYSKLPKDSEERKKIRKIKIKYNGKKKIPTIKIQEKPELHELDYEEFKSKFLINLLTNKYYLNQLIQTTQVYTENQTSKYHKSADHEKFFTDIDYNVIFLNSLYGEKSKAKKIVSNRFKF